VSTTVPAGFRAAGLAAGLKASGAADLAVIVNDGAPEVASAAAVFTANRFQAAPVQWSAGRLASPAAKVRPPRAIVLNSGGANACTGPSGLADAKATAARAAELLGLSPQEVLVCSTGLIGQSLPMDQLLPGLDRAVAALGPDGWDDAAAAVMTTDTHPKTATAAPADGAYAIVGLAKGAGMLAPGLATMLVVVATDAIVPAASLQGALKAATGATFDRTDSDGCMSTNDSVILLASGRSATAPDPVEFTALLTELCTDLARQLIGDAEGASHDIAITVAGAATEDGALAVARAIARSNLFKTAVYGNDPNWGRVLAAAGTVPAAVAPYEPDAVDVTINGVTVCRGGAIGEDRSKVDLTGRAVHVQVDLHAGPAAATIWTNDLTHDYVHENSAYSS